MLLLVKMYCNSLKCLFQSFLTMSTFLSWVAGASTPNNSGRSIDLFLTQLESMPKLLDKRQSAADLAVSNGNIK